MSSDVRRAERMVLGGFEQKETKRTKGRPTSLFPSLSSVDLGCVTRLGADFLFGVFRVFRGYRFSFHIREINISSHSGAQVIIVARQSNLHAEYLFDSVGDSLHVARGKFGLPIYLFDKAIEIFPRK